MVLRHESMSAKNGDVEDLVQRESVGVGVRALVGSSWGFVAVPDPGDAAARRAGAEAAAVARASARVAGPDVDLIPVEVRQDRWASPCAEDPLGVPLAEKGDLVAGVTATMRAAGVPLAEASYQVWDTTKWFVSSEGSRLEQHIRECGAAMNATAIGAGETQRRSYPGIRGQYGTRGWELVARARPARPRRAGRRGGAGAAHRAGVPGRGDRPHPRQRADGAADPRVGRARGRAGPDPRLGGRLRRHLLAGPGPARLAALRLRPDDDHRRRHPARRARLVRLRRRGHPGRAGGHRPGRHLDRCPVRTGLRRRSPGSSVRRQANGMSGRTGGPGCRWCG